MDKDSYWNWETSQMEKHAVLPSFESTNEGEDEGLMMILL